MDLVHGDAEALPCLAGDPGKQQRWGSWAYSQSSVRPRQSSCRCSALMPGPNKCSTGLVAKNCDTRYSRRLLKPSPFRIMATVAVPTLT